MKRNAIVIYKNTKRRELVDSKTLQLILSVPVLKKDVRTYKYI